MLNFITDPRTGLGRFKNFNISNYSLMMKLADLCSQKSIDDIMLDFDVQERIKFYKDEQEKFIEQIKRCTAIKDNFAVVDLRREEIIHAGNRFMVFALYPECELSVHEFYGKEKKNTVLAVSKSIFNRNCSADLGALMYEFDGGGHVNSGTCQTDNEKADRILNEILSRIKMPAEAALTAESEKLHAAS